MPRRRRRRGGHGYWPRYIPVAERRDKARRKARSLAKQGHDLCPIELEARSAISKTFWGKAWCTNLESYGDYSNRLPRGRSYVRNGSVVHLAIEPGHVAAYVSGTSMYTVDVTIKSVAKKKWKKLISSCTGEIESVLDLLAGRLSDSVMNVIACPDSGLFPSPKEIEFSCSCPDWANMCKHVAAALYGVGTRLDESPELLFTLRGVDHVELVSTMTADTSVITGAVSPDEVLAGEDLGELFGIELGDGLAEQPATAEVSRSRQTAKAVRKGRAGSKVKPTEPKKPKKLRQRTKLGDKTIASRKGAAISIRKGKLLRPAELLEMGIPRSTFNNWFAQGALERTGERGVYRATSQTKRKILEVRARCRGDRAS